MNPEYVFAGYVHTFPEMLFKYFVTPFTNIFVIFALVIMFANTYMFKKLWKFKTKDRMITFNVLTLSIYFIMGVISAFSVSRLGPHGMIAMDNCDDKYMFIPTLLFYVDSVINIIYFILNIIKKVSKDSKELNDVQKVETKGEKHVENGDEDIEESANLNNSKFPKIDISGYIENAKNKINVNNVKEKVNEYTEELKNLIDKSKEK